MCVYQRDRPGTLADTDLATAGDGRNPAPVKAPRVMIGRVATIWITYAWADNEGRDVDFIAQELVRTGVNVKLDRWSLTAGKRLWDQIANFITNPRESDAWLFYSTQNSLASEPCREELAYALDRALTSRGDDFPIIALFPSSVEHNLIPASIRVRLFVSLTDPEWKERVAAAAERRPLSVSTAQVQPFVMQSISPVPEPFKYAIELRPRAGVWYPFTFAVPASEKDQVRFALRCGPPRRIPHLGGVVFSRGEGLSPDVRWYFELGGEAASPTNSYYAFLREMPSALLFGQEGADGQVWTAEGVRITDLHIVDGPVTVGQR